MIKNILWDFDGVILDSMPTRDFGFRQIFKNYDKDLVEKFIKYHNNNGGLSRFHKIKYFYNSILKKEISQEKIDLYANEFSKIMKEELVKPKYLITESIEFIKENLNNYNFHIVSGSAHTELNYLCEQLKINNYFLSINGSPTPKNTLVKNLLEKENYNINETILIGDSLNDYEAAEVNNINFYGYNNSTLEEKGNYIDSFKDFEIK